MGNPYTENISISRRSFVKGLAATGASAVLYGCSKDSGSELLYAGGGVVEKPTSSEAIDLSDTQVFYGTNGHNCGGRCISKAYVKNGRIIRLVADDSMLTIDNTSVQRGSMNATNYKPCSRCRSYTARLYHPGRLKYPMKQTAKRGDLNGFKRISWEQAYDEITRKHKAIFDKYGAEAIHSLEANGNQSFIQGGLSGPFGKRSTVFKMVGGHSIGWDSYSFHQLSYFGNKFTGFEDSPYLASSLSTNDVADYCKTMVLFGTNSLTTSHPNSNATIQSIQKMKDRDPKAKVYFIGPECNDTPLTVGDEWIQCRAGTDSAMLSAMVYEMIVNTFDENGNIKPNPMLDVDYLDTMVYGFFDSPGYWLNEVTGEFDLIKRAPLPNEEKYDDSSGQMWRYVNPVPAGKSMSAWIMGDDNRLTKARYDAGGVYTAKQFSSTQTFRNMDICSYTSAAGTNAKYELKRQFKVKKSPEWAEKISGVSAETIRRFAKIYGDPSNHPINTHLSGGFQKKYNGIYDIFMLEVLLLVAKCWGKRGFKFGQSFISRNTSAPVGLLNIPDYSAQENPYRPVPPAMGGIVPPIGITEYLSATGIGATIPIISCTQWYNALFYAFGTQLKNGGYTPKYVPDWVATKGYAGNDGQVYSDNSGVKALVKRPRVYTSKYEGNIPTYTEIDIQTGIVHTFYDYVGHNTNAQNSGSVTYSGFRFIMNTGGNMLATQSMNNNDHTAVYEALPLSGSPDDSETMCIVTMDNFLAPGARWSDYILPNTTSWEQQDVHPLEPGAGIFVYTPIVSTPPGESKNMRDIANEYLKKYEILKPEYSGAATNFCGGVADQTVEEMAKKQFQSKAENAPTPTTSNPYYKMTWKEYLKHPFTNLKPRTNNTPPAYGTLRSNMDAYLASSTKATIPFIRKVAGYYPTAITDIKAPGVYGPGAGFGYGNQFSEYITAPFTSLRNHVYSDIMVWQFKNRFSMWHGHLPTDQRGQNNTDFDGDSEAYPIPMYYPYEDYFKEAYGVFAGTGELPERGLYLCTSHDRFRAHSTLSENPYTRELSHRVKGGSFASGNDWNEYSMYPEAGTDGTYKIQRLNGAIAKGDLSTATWSELWMNDEDAAERGIVDGDLVQASNPIGAVRCIAKVTKRCVSGHVNLHEGAWYDPNPIDGVDDGGCCNTLMSHKPSRIDQGNAQQQAYVSVRKVTNDDLKKLGFAL